MNTEGNVTEVEGKAMGYVSDRIERWSQSRPMAPNLISATVPPVRFAKSAVAAGDIKELAG
jgi:hypothetical protein